MKISDSHTDFLTNMDSFEARENYVKKSVKQGARNISCAIFTTNKNFKVEDIETFDNEIKLLGRKYAVNLNLSIEDLGFIKNKQELYSILKLKPFSATLTWNYANNYAGGALTNKGITILGKNCVKLLEENKILVDTAHLSKRAFWQYCKITKLPIYNSHSNIYALKKHKRNLTNKQISMIVKSNGFLGLTLYNKFISNKNISSKDIALQFDYLIKRFGYKNFGLGTDLYGIDIENLPTDLKSYGEINNLVEELKKLGYSKKVVNCLLNKNFEDFIKRIKRKYYNHLL